MNRLTLRNRNGTADVIRTRVINSMYGCELMAYLIDKLADYEDIAERGHITDSDCSYKKITYMRPIKHPYGEDYFKYSCPVCDMLGNKHQVLKGDTNCTLCNINLLWEE